MNLDIQEYKPNEFLQPYVQAYWQGKFNIRKSRLFVQKVVPNGFVELIIHLSDRHCFLFQSKIWTHSPDYTLIGMFTRFYEVHFDETVSTFGIRFKPEGIYNLFGIPAAEFSEDYIDMESVMGKSFSEFSARIKEQQTVSAMIRKADQYLLRNLQKNNINFYYLNRAAEFIRQQNGMFRMDELIENVYISNRQLEREFKEKIGITPKQYMRIARLNEVNRQLQNPGTSNLTSLSYKNGYSDQAHFIREFKKFSGDSPAKFLKARKDFIVNV
jgi:AraC-like DNA-binding protein